LRIEDTGPGIQPDDRQAVFEKFNQLPDQLTEKPSGTGIGLATSRAIVARFGGLIWCEDSSMGGASFVVLLPAEGQPKLAGFAAGTGAGGGF
jgi:signal transduction histidine kinase